MGAESGLSGLGLSMTAVYLYWEEDDEKMWWLLLLQLPPL